MEVASSHRQVPVTEASQPSAARFAAQDAAELAGFSAEDIYRVGLVTTELATNLVKHATGGELLVRAIRGAPAGEVEILAIDRGPGINDVSRSMTDGQSTAGTSGNGLGAIKRLADDFELYTQAGRGTVTLARVRGRRATAAPAGPLTIAAVSVAKRGETICGDAWQVYHYADGALALIADGLGHGIDAGGASQAAIAAWEPARTLGLPASLEHMHQGIRHTRGAAAAIAEVRPASRVMRFAGVGNIAGAICGFGTIRHAVSSNGTLGHEARYFKEFQYPWETGALLVMHSDGLGTHWTLDDYPGLRQRHPVIAAAVLYRDFSRQRDDVTVLVGREPL